jgi:drug/metabolite transporter (DMT)-like permease
MKRRLFSILGWTVGICGLLFLAGAGNSFAGSSVPELDPGSAIGGIALAIGAALLIAERYRNRG